MASANSTSIDPGPLAPDALKSQALRATAWTFGGYLGSRALRLVSNLIMTRLLLPDAFGVMAIVALFTQGLAMFSDIGIGPSIIQNRRGDDPEYLNTAWTIQVVRGFILWMAACALAYPASLFYENMPDLEYLIPVAGLNAIIAGFNSTSLHTLNRHLDLSKENILSIGAKLISLIAMIIAALITRSVWALVIGGLVSSLVTMIYSHRLIEGHRNRFQWDRECARELFSFGRWIFISTALTFLAMSSDRLILGKLISSTVLGVYAIAYLWYDAPRSLVMRVSAKVIFPTMSKARELSRDAFKKRIARNRSRFLPVAIFGLAGVVCFADILIGVLYSPEYHAAGWMLSFLALGMWWRILDQTVSPALLVYRKLQYNPLGSAFRIVLIAALLPIGYVHYGIAGAVIAIAIADIPNYIAYQWGLWRNNLSLIGQDLRMTLGLLALIAVLLAGRWALGFGLPIDRMNEPIAAEVETAPNTAAGERPT